MKYLSKIAAQNFKAFNHKQEIELNGKHLAVYGNNGSGKSSIYWALYTFLQSSNKSRTDLDKYFEVSYTLTEPTFTEIASLPNDVVNALLPIKNIEYTTQESFINELKSKLSAEQYSEHKHIIFQHTFTKFGDRSLLNIHAVPETLSQIELTVKDGDTEKTYSLSKEKHDSDSELFKQSNLSSEFIAHRLLFNFYNFGHSERIDLAPVFERDVFPYFTSEDDDRFLNEIIREINNKITTESKNALVPLIKILNDFIADEAEKINLKSSEFLKKHFLDDKDIIRIKLVIQNDFRVDWDIPKSKRKLIRPQIYLNIEHKAQSTNTFEILSRPHSFLNEATLNAIALTIRLMLFESRPKTDLQFLILDDLLLSLDMSNRKKVIDILIELYSERYQLLIFTHDKGFYNEVLRAIDNKKEDWTLYNFFRAKNIGANPKKKLDGTEMEKAVKAFAQNDYENCASHLRKTAEETIKSYLEKFDKNFSENQRWKGLAQLINTIEGFELKSYETKVQSFLKEIENIDTLNLLKKDINTNETITEVAKKGKLNASRAKIMNNLIKIKEQQEEKVVVKQLITEIKNIKDRILNPSAHSSEHPYFETEIEEAIVIIQELREFVKNKIEAA